MGTAVIDWLSFTFDGRMLGDIWDVRRHGRQSAKDAGYVHETDPVIPVLKWFKSWGVGQVSAMAGNGLYGFERSARIYSVRDHRPLCIGVVAWGGKNQKGRVYVSVDGSGCSLVKDWIGVNAVLESLEALITRVDVAVDDLGGETISLEKAASWYEEGGFTGNGRRPKYKCEGDWLTRQGSGRTLYVGRRENGKYARVYEKGQQLGAPSSLWTRFEVELHNVSREIPLDVVLQPSSYFAGCYPCCEALVDVGAERIRTFQEESAISLDRLKTFCRVAYGKLLYVMKSLGEDVPEIEKQMVEDLMLMGVPRRLEKVSLHYQRSPGAVPAFSGGYSNEVEC